MGGKITYKGNYQNVKLTQENYELQSDMYVLPLEGCDMVLGDQWLRILGPILWDFSKLRMKFIVDGCKYTLKGLN